MAGGEFTFTHLKPGRYRPIALVGETVVAIGDWIDLAESQELHIDPLVTEPAGSVRVRVERSDDAVDSEPSIGIRPADSSRRSSKKVGPGNVVVFPNMSPGEFILSVGGKGTAWVTKKIRIASGVETIVDVRVRGGARCSLIVELPDDKDLGVLTVRIVDKQDGSVYWTMEDRQAKTLRRPYNRRIWVPRGSWEFVVATTTGLRAKKTLHVRDLKGKPAISLKLE